MVFVAGRCGSSCCLAGRSAVVEPRFAFGRLNCAGTKRRPAFSGHRTPTFAARKSQRATAWCAKVVDGTGVGAGLRLFLVVVWILNTGLEVRICLCAKIYGCNSHLAHTWFGAATSTGLSYPVFRSPAAIPLIVSTMSARISEVSGASPVPVARSFRSTSTCK